MGRIASRDRELCTPLSSSARNHCNVILTMVRISPLLIRSFVGLSCGSRFVPRCNLQLPPVREGSPMADVLTLTPQPIRVTATGLQPIYLALDVGGYDFLDME